MQTVLAVSGALGLTALTIVGAAYALFRFFGAKWLDSRFERSLEEFRHEKLKELESLKAEMNRRIDRSAIQNQREFEILPQLFRMLNEAHGAVAGFTSPLQQVPDVDRMSSDELEDHLSQMEFKDYEKKKIIESNPRSTSYRNVAFWKNLNQAHAPYREFNNYLITNSIFVDDDLLQQIESVRDMMSEALHEAKFEHEYDDPRPDRWKAREALRKNGRGKIDFIRNEVKAKLVLKNASSVEAIDKG